MKLILDDEVVGNRKIISVNGHQDDLEGCFILFFRLMLYYGIPQEELWDFFIGDFPMDFEKEDFKDESL